MGETTCKQADMTLAIAARRHPSAPFLRNPRPWCVRSAFFQRPVKSLAAGSRLTVVVRTSWILSVPGDHCGQCPLHQPPVFLLCMAMEVPW